MKALTIHQPYAELIARGDKLVENRTWKLHYRGPLLVHAGNSRDWLDGVDERRYPGLVFGAIVALVDVVGCTAVDVVPERFRKNDHAHGPFCFLLSNVRRLRHPVQCRGHQGLWVPEPSVMAAVERQTEVAAE